jgi:hypothetical protein
MTRAAAGSYTGPMEWDLWIDYHRTDGDGLTHGNVRDASEGADIREGRYLVVGNEEAEAAVAQVVAIREKGTVLVRVLPGSVDDHRDLLTGAGVS